MLYITVQLTRVFMSELFYTNNKLSKHIYFSF